MANHRSIIRREERRRNRSKKTSRFHPIRPRLVVYRSLKHIEAQIINDFEGVTLVSASSRDKDLSTTKGTKTEVATLVGKSIAVKALKAGVSNITFDRGGYLYHGRVKSLAEGAREAGLKF